MTACQERDLSFQFQIGRRQCLLTALPQFLLLPTLVLPVWWPYWPLSIFLGVLLLWWIFRQGFPQGKFCQNRITGLSFEGCGVYRLRLADGRSLDATLMSGAIAHPRLLALRFLGDDGQVYRIIQPVSSASTQQLAPLRRQLLHPQAAAGDHSNPSA